jgi:hypothetical protein
MVKMGGPDSVPPGNYSFNCWDFCPIKVSGDRNRNGVSHPIRRWQAMEGDRRGLVGQGGEERLGVPALRGFMRKVRLTERLAMRVLTK